MNTDYILMIRVKRWYMSPLTEPDSIYINGNYNIHTIFSIQSKKKILILWQTNFSECEQRGRFLFLLYKKVASPWFLKDRKMIKDDTAHPTYYFCGNFSMSNKHTINARRDFVWFFWWRCTCPSDESKYNQLYNSNSNDRCNGFAYFLLFKTLLRIA